MKKLIFLQAVIVMTATTCGKEKGIEAFASIGTVTDIGNSAKENSEVEPANIIGRQF